MSKRPPKPSLSPAAQTALETYRDHLTHEQDLRPATRRNYLGDIQQFMAWCEQEWADDFSPTQVTTPALTRYRAYLKQALQRKPTTINRYLVSLKRYFGWLLENETIERDPARPVKLVKEVDATPRHLSDQEEEALMAAVQRGGRLRDIILITLMLHTGLRVGEVCRLQWQHVILNARSGRLQVWGKRNTYREVPLNATARQALQQLRYDQADGDDNDLPAYVFPSIRTGGHLTTRGVGFIIKKYAGRAGLPTVRPHDLRHRFGYRVAETTPLHQLAQILGHKSLDTTMIYIQATQQDLQKSVESIAWE